MVGCYCNFECGGYTEDPRVGDLWPGETEEEFGFPVSDAGTKEVEPSTALEKLQ